MTLKERLLAKRSIEDKGYITPCWIFTGARSKRYGFIKDYQKITINSHVASARLFLKDYNPRLNVLHKCNIGYCFNPDHLYQGTQRENAQDIIKAGHNKNSNKTHCKRGHPLSGDNLGKNGNARYCIECNRRRYIKNNEIIKLFKNTPR